MTKALTVESSSTGIEHVRSHPQRWIEFLKSVRSEMRKVVTPTRAEVQSNTAIVVLTVFLFAAFFWVVDTVFGRLIEQTINQLAKH